MTITQLYFTGSTAQLVCQFADGVQVRSYGPDYYAPNAPIHSTRVSSTRGHTLAPKTASGLTEDNADSFPAHIQAAHRAFYDLLAGRRPTL